MPGLVPDLAPDLADAHSDRNTPAHFDVYRADHVSITSTLFSGGDWHWRLTSYGGFVLVDCGGYGSQSEALVAVDSLRSDAWSATVSSRP